MLLAEWPHAQLFTYGSVASGFGGRSSDIDLCLSLPDAGDVDAKRAAVARIAELAEARGCTRTLALVKARMPVAKFVEPASGVECDVCINNHLAVVNTQACARACGPRAAPCALRLSGAAPAAAAQMLRHYAEVDDRLRPLVYAVKHWAKRRKVNEPFTGTLSSYCYVLMCIHLLQTRRPPVLPCLQAMAPREARAIDGWNCSYCEAVGPLKRFGAANSESVAQLLHSFFEYWRAPAGPGGAPRARQRLSGSGCGGGARRRAVGHDYGTQVVSVRVGGWVTKRAKDWTTRHGSERHLICVEDPFQVGGALDKGVRKRPTSPAVVQLRCVPWRGGGGARSWTTTWGAWWTGTASRSCATSSRARCASCARSATRCRCCSSRSRSRRRRAAASRSRREREERRRARRARVSSVDRTTCSRARSVLPCYTPSIRRLAHTAARLPLSVFCRSSTQCHEMYIIIVAKNRRHQSAAAGAASTSIGSALLVGSAGGG